MELDVVARRDERGRGPGGDGRRRRQGFAVDFAIGSERQGRQHDKGRRQHVVGQLRFEERPQIRPGQRPGAGVGDDIRDELALAWRVLAQHDERVAQRGFLAQDRFDLRGLDAMPAYLQLVIEPAQELEVAVGPIPHEIARAVHRGSRALGVRSGDEPLGGESGAVPVAAGDAVAADVELPGNAYRHPLPVPVQDRERRFVTGRPMGSVRASGGTDSTGCHVAKVTVSVGPYTWRSRPGAPAWRHSRTRRGSTASPPNSTFFTRRRRSAGTGRSR